jgi:hypothetical protein
MTPFEYVSVLISIILGLGITLVLTGIAELIKRWSNVVHFWPYQLWIALVFVLHIQEWWATYDLKTITTWNLPSFLFVILYPILLFILANLLFPSKWPKKGIDMKAFYFENCNKYFFCVVLLALLSIIQNISLAHYALQDQGVQFTVLTVFTGMLLRPTRNTTIHTLLAIAMFLIMLVSLFFTRESLVISD